MRTLEEVIKRLEEADADWIDRGLISHEIATALLILAEEIRRLKAGQ